MAGSFYCFRKYFHALISQTSKQTWVISIVSGFMLPSRPDAILPAFTCDYGDYFPIPSPFMKCHETSLLYRYFYVKYSDRYSLVLPGQEFPARTRIRKHTHFLRITFARRAIQIDGFYR